MIVEALDPGPGRSWPSAGTTLVVLEIYVERGKEPDYRVERDDGTPVLIAASEVRIVDGSLPASWSVRFSDETGTLDIGPAPWQTPGFWEQFFDFDPLARQTYADHLPSTDDLA
jgi:hypothetical protein